MKQVLVAHAGNPSYLGVGDQKDCCLRLAWANSLRDLISKITRANWTGGVVQTHLASALQEPPLEV
jgi:hypothetical protein